MWIFSTFNEKRYWILFIPTIIIFVVFIVFAPEYIFEKNYASLLLIFMFPILFWSTYHIWKYFGDKKKLNNTDDSCDL